LSPLISSLIHTEWNFSSWQASSSGHPSYLFTNPEELAEIYLITGWDDAAGHEKWIKSPRNEELLQVAKRSGT